MALLESELELIRWELGWNALSVGAIPYIGIAAIFEKVVQPYLLSGLITYSSTQVVAADTPTVVALTLGAVSGTNTQGTAVAVHVNDTLVVDVAYAQETAVVQAIRGNSVSVELRFAHSGTYPVTVQGGEAIVRWLLRRCWLIRERIANSESRAGIKKVDEIEFFQGKAGGGTTFEELTTRQKYWRSELKRILFGTGDPTISSISGGGSGISVY
ncbi:MAG: hypothetical protein WC551_07630 [Patescibacteria group bacterium]